MNRTIRKMEGNVSRLEIRIPFFSRVILSRSSRDFEIERRWNVLLDEFKRVIVQHGSSSKARALSKLSRRKEKDEGEKKRKETKR